jgi:hypothetical protein
MLKRGIRDASCCGDNPDPKRREGVWFNEFAGIRARSASEWTLRTLTMHDSLARHARIV